jgi:hypothetical protein
MITIGVMAATSKSFQEFTAALPGVRRFNRCNASTEYCEYLYLGTALSLGGTTLDQVIMLPRFWENEDTGHIIGSLPQHMRAE